MPRRSVSASALRDHQLLRGDLVLEKSGGSADQPVGSVAMFDLSGHAVCSNFNARIQVANSVDSRFACYLMNSLYWSGFTRQFVNQTTGIQNLDANALLAQRCMLPPLDEQQRIADFLDTEAARLTLLIGRRNDQIEVLDELTLSTIDDAIDPVHHHPLVRLGYLALVQSGVTVDGSRQHDGDIVTLPYLRVANVQAGRVDLGDVSEITVPRRVAATSRLRAGDVLMTEGGDLDKLGRGTVWHGEIADCLHQNHVFAVRPDLNVVVPEYLALVTRTPMARKYFESTGNKTTNLASTSSSKIRDFRIPLIDLCMQRAIVKEVDARLRSLSEFDKRLSQQLVLLAERRQALITAAVTGQIDVTTARGVSA
ncbi:MAG: restriction endonuclease subunit S [Pseudonocardiaceae bacterium]